MGLSGNKEGVLAKELKFENGYTRVYGLGQGQGGGRMGNSRN